MVLLFGIVLVVGLFGNDLFSDESILEGAWVGIDNNEWILIFNGSNYMFKYKNGTNRQKGTFSLNSSNTRFTLNVTHDWENEEWIARSFAVVSCDIDISANTFTIFNAPSNWFTGPRTYVRQ